MNEQRIALITGGTGGIGTAICQRMAQQYRVIACYYKEGRHEIARAWQQTQQSLGFDIDIVYGDITKFNDCEHMTKQVIERYGQIDILVHNAGVTHDKALKNMSLNDWQEVLDANLNSSFNISRHVLPHMIEKKYGRMIYISSINGRKGQIGQCNYAASKAALYGFVKSLARETALKGITVNSISPGYIETAMLKSLKPEVLEHIIADIPIGRLGQPEEIASMVNYLASDEAAFITGSNIDVNGGQYM